MTEGKTPSDETKAINLRRKGLMRHGIATTSRIKMWYLTKVQGKRVAYSRIRPRYIMLGSVFYATTWVIANA